MTREFKVGMTGKTTTDDAFVLIRRKGEWLYAFMDDASETGVIARFTLTGAGVTDFWGDLIHPDDAKEIRVTEGEAITGPSDERVAEIKAALRGVSAVDLAPIPGRIDPLRFQAACAALTGIVSTARYVDTGELSDDDVAEMAVGAADALLARLSEKEGRWMSERKKPMRWRREERGNP